MEGISFNMSPPQLLSPFPVWPFSSKVVAVRHRGTVSEVR